MCVRDICILFQVLVFDLLLFLHSSCMGLLYHVQFKVFHMIEFDGRKDWTQANLMLFTLLCPKTSSQGMWVRMLDQWKLSADAVQPYPTPAQLQSKSNSLKRKRRQSTDTQTPVKKKLKQQMLNLTKAKPTLNV